MFTLIGLGNPGKKYADTRHNAGRMLAAWLRAKGQGLRAKGESEPKGFEILETDCFMNQSGEFVRRIIQNTRKTQKSGQSEIQKFGEPDFPTLRSSDSPRISGTPSILSFPKLIIAHDDLDLKLGEWKIHFGRGPRLHRGILSIEKALGTKDFWRVRIGVDNREQITENRERGEEYVLRPFRRGEKVILKQTFKSIKTALLEFCTKNTRSRVFSA